VFALAAAVAGTSTMLFAAAPAIGPCRMFPSDHIWNVRVDDLPVDPQSGVWVATIGTDRPLHPDFGAGFWPPGSGSPMGIPFTTVPPGQPRVPVTFTYASESDPGPYPIPPDAPIEGGAQSTGDRHVVVVDTGDCRLYELYNAFPDNGGNRWRADSGAVFDLNGYALRPRGWTSADAAGLPILPGLVRYDEVAAGEIRHAVRFTAPQTRRAFVWPARHFASQLTGSQYPPMGQRFRLKADVDISGFHPQVQVILTALKRYGMILADNGSAWYISGTPDNRWDNEVLAQLKTLRGSHFEAVDVSSLMLNPDSGQAAVAASRIIPHLGTGRDPILTFDTTLLVINTGPAAAVSLQFFNPDGNPWPVAFEGGEPSPEHVLNLEAGHSLTLQLATLHENGLQTGYAQVLAPDSVSGTAVFRGLDSSSGVPLYEAAVAWVRPHPRLTLPVDSQGDYDTGLALVYPPGTGDRVKVALRLYDQHSQLVGETDLDLDPGDYRARFIGELFPEGPIREAAREMRGVLEVNSPVPLGAVGLRQYRIPGLWFPRHVPLLATLPVVKR
jgi:hypothetical protein